MVLGHAVKTLESKETRASKKITITHNSVFAAHRLQCRIAIHKIDIRHFFLVTRRALLTISVRQVPSRQNALWLLPLQFRQRYEGVGLPWRKTIGPPSPTSTLAILVSSSETRFRYEGSSVEITGCVMMFVRSTFRQTQSPFSLCYWPSTVRDDDCKSDIRELAEPLRSFPALLN